MSILSYIYAAVVATSGLLASVQGSIDSPKFLKLNGWLPTWRFQSGVAEIDKNAQYFSSISPFSFEVATSGVVVGALPTSSKSWMVMASSSEKYDIKVVPTIAWFDGEAMDKVFPDPVARKKHIDSILAVVMKYKFKGIDIDYEARYSRTKPYYETFVRELSERIHKEGKLLYCTAEARTPIEDEIGGVPLYEKSVAPSTYKTLNERCDSIRIMAYDQRDDDRELVKQNSSVFYRPVADDSWVEKTIHEALYEIDRKKLVLGIPNYGNIYLATSTPSKGVRYKYVGALNFDQAVARAALYRAHPARNAAGEMQFYYNKNGNRYWVTYPDVVSLRKKLLLAEKYGLSGVSIFKIDGTMNEEMWKEIQAHVTSMQKK